MVPISVGVDTEGSITTPAMRASLYSIRPTTGILSTDGIIPLAHSFDTPGILGKCVRDLADMLAVLVDPETTKVPNEGYQSVIGTGWQDLRVGTLDVESWLYPTDPKDPAPEASAQMVGSTRMLLTLVLITSRLEKHMPHILELPSWQNLTMKMLIYVIGRNLTLMVLDLRFFLFLVCPGIAVTWLLLMNEDLEFENDLNKYLAGLEGSNVQSLQEMVDWNIAHPSEGLPEGKPCVPPSYGMFMLTILIEYPDQSRLIRCLNAKFSDEEIQAIRKVNHEVGSSFEKTLDKYQIDVIIGPGDSFFTTFAAANGCPVAAMPLSYLDLNGRPFGLMAMVRPHQESLLLKVLGAFESTFPSRQPPKAFMNAQSSSSLTEVKNF